MAGIINAENEGDLQAQIEEVEALASIYGDEWCVIDEASRIFCIKISSDLEEPKRTACLQIILPPGYPSTAPPIYQINLFLASAVQRGYEALRGPNWQTASKTFMSGQPENVTLTAEEEVNDDEDAPDFRTFKLNTESAYFFMDHANDEEVPPIKHGNTITDRRSTFQPHLAPVVTPRQVKMVLEKLYENKKIASATHNIYAYRIYCEDKHSFLQDCEDDGETAAGGRLLHLLQILDVRNVMVVVSRWYGGILLGPDRFKHINNCARSILVEEGYTAFTDEATKSGAKTKRPKHKKTK
uniref:protein IMPACT isoform X3 n=1 Tax=Monopterus albus TaxID=43700 RepID=UPI0009B4D841|nr:protein IMPACT isoform X3 [Monopterus albus]